MQFVMMNLLIIGKEGDINFYDDNGQYYNMEYTGFE